MDEKLKLTLDQELGTIKKMLGEIEQSAERIHSCAESEDDVRVMGVIGFSLKEVKLFCPVEKISINARPRTGTIKKLINWEFKHVKLQLARIERLAERVNLAADGWGDAALLALIIKDLKQVRVA